MVNFEEVSLKIVEQPVRFLVPGMEVAKDVYSGDGVVLINKGSQISTGIIKKLSTWEINSISIFAEATINPITSPKVQQFIHNYNQSVSAMKSAFDNIRQTQEVPIEEITQTAKQINDSISEVGNVIDQLYNLPPCDDYTLRHSVNVSAISALIATWLKYPPENISAISLVGLLHDVGKCKLPPELLHKPYKLKPEQYELYKKHALFGYDLVNKTPGISKSILAGILEHHERMDGCGYPGNLTGGDIHPYAKIVAIADLFDEELTINSEHAGVQSPYLSLENLKNNLYRLDAQAGITFINNMLNFLSGNQVMLSNGQQGRVVFINTVNPARSMIQKTDGTILDLSQQQEIFIHYVIR